MNLWLALEQAFVEMCDFESAESICKLQKLDTKISNSEQLFNRQFLSLSHDQSETRCKKRKEWAMCWEADQIEKIYGPLWPDLLLEPRKQRRLRVGYLSADFCNHPVGRFMLPILEHHDREKVEIWELIVAVTMTGLVNNSKTFVSTGWIVGSTTIIRRQD